MLRPVATEGGEGIGQGDSSYNRRKSSEKRGGG